MTLRLLPALTLALLLIGCGGASNDKAETTMNDKDGTARSTHVDWKDIGMNFATSGVTLKTDGATPMVVGTLRYNGVAASDSTMFHLVMTDKDANLMGPIGFTFPPFEPSEERPLTIPLPPKSEHFDPAMVDPGSVRLNPVAPSQHGARIDSRRPDNGQ